MTALNLLLAAEMAQKDLLKIQAAGPHKILCHMQPEERHAAWTVGMFM